MSVVNLELNATGELVRQPIIWRLGKLFNVVTNIRRARVTDDYGFVLLQIEGSVDEVKSATDYLASLGLTAGSGEPSATAARPEDAFPQPNTINVRLSTVNAEQGH